MKKPRVELSPEVLRRWVVAVGRTGILRIKRPLFGLFEAAPAGDFSDSWLKETRERGKANAE